MKKVSSRNDLVTKSYLKKALEPLATKQDLDSLGKGLRGEIKENRSAIKELKKTDERIINGVISLEERLDKRCDDLQSQIDEKFDKIMSGQDEVMSELKTIRDEITATFDLYDKHDKKLENHEERIKGLEGHVFA